MFINPTLKEKFLSLLISSGIILLILSLYSIIDMGLGLSLGVFSWILASFVFKWLDFDIEEKNNIFHFKTAFSNLLKSLGIWILLFSVISDFINISFAIFVVIISLGCFGILECLLNPSTNYKLKRNLPSISIIQKKFKKIDENLMSVNMKLKCIKCSQKIRLNDVFCAYCGTLLLNN